MVNITHRLRPGRSECFASTWSGRWVFMTNEGNNWRVGWAVSLPDVVGKGPFDIDPVELPDGVLVDAADLDIADSHRPGSFRTPECRFRT
jgi:hypothetical protein